ncbi:caspase domain-containing protein [Crepidotus variabilis]|uniref:Caspase domain-containing protein n=1 Tax=Crepidotus variabilis TaxID=179855 RepID=A0A9P6EG72_9AGAR|nr:caspase domain-containing protein [Crepidotus variabilis]
MAQTSHETNAFYAALAKTPIGLLFPHLNFDQSQRQKKALLIGSTYGSKDYHWTLVSPINDVRNMKELLIDLFGYTVTTLHEGDDADGRPTHANIQQAINEFILEEDNVDYVLMYAGHSFQMDTLSSKEEDGQSEYIIPCDALRLVSRREPVPAFEDVIDTEKVIFDYDLHKALVKKMEDLNVKGCQLVAIFDSCHSCTLLNLKHHRCNRIGNITSTLRRASRRVILEPMQDNFGFSFVRTETQRSLDLPKSPVDGVDPKRFPLPLISRWSRFRQCSGFCLRVPTLDKPLVICISAAKDSQATWESDSNGSLIGPLIQLFRQDRNPTYKDVMISAQEGVTSVRGSYIKQVNDKYAKAKQEAQKKKGLPRALWRFASSPKHRAEKADQLEAIKDRTDPQLSSMRPLVRYHLICVLFSD